MARRLLVPQQSRQVLSEEEYTSTLSAIVQRDYFPEIPDLERQAAILERRALGDVAGAVALRRAVRRLKENEESLAAEAEEGERDLNDNVRRRARPLDQESLSGFHARVTNEDDQEFESNQKRQVRENRDRLDKLLRPSQGPQVPLLMSDMASDQYRATPNRLAPTEWNAPSVRNGLFFSPTPVRNGQSGTFETGPIERIQNGDKNTSSSSAQLALMAPPADVPKLLLPKHQLVEYVPKHALEKRIEPSQTRFPQKIVPFPVNSGRGLAPVRDTWDTETDGSATDASTDLDAPLRPVQAELNSYKQQRGRNQQSYVTMTPLIIPGASGSESPIMTWGTVDSTPLVISGQEQVMQVAGYGVAMESGREKAARKAADKLAHRAKRAKSANSSASTPTMAAGHDRKTTNTSSLTPASLSLFQTISQPVSSRSRDGFASSLRSSYTPKVRSGSAVGSSIRSHSSGRKGRAKDSAFNATPLATGK
jgi:protein DGCR14